MNGDDEIETGENGRKSGDEDAYGCGNHRCVRKATAVGSVESPTGIHSPRNDGIQREARTHNVDVPANKIEPWEGQVACANHQRHQKIPERSRNGRYQEEEDHDDAVHGEKLVVSLRLNQCALRLDQMEPHKNGKKAANKKHQGN